MERCWSSHVLHSKGSIGVQKQRGRWSAVDSIYQFGWSGSAFIGGILVDRAGFDWCFLITAMAQCLGWLVSAPHPTPSMCGARFCAGFMVSDCRLHTYHFPATVS